MMLCFLHTLILTDDIPFPDFPSTNSMSRGSSVWQSAGFLTQWPRVRVPPSALSFFLERSVIIHS